MSAWLGRRNVYFKMKIVSCIPASPLSGPGRGEKEDEVAIAAGRNGPCCFSAAVALETSTASMRYLPVLVFTEKREVSGADQ